MIGVRSLETNMFEITFQKPQDRDEVLENYSSITNPRFEPVRNQHTENSCRVTISGIPAEYLILAVSARYFIQPKIARQKIVGTHIYNGIAHEDHSGLKREIGRFLFIGPNMSVKVMSSTYQPMQENKVRCSQCLVDGHIVYTCTNKAKCSYCKNEGHRRADCWSLQPSTAENTKDSEPREQQHQTTVRAEVYHPVELPLDSEESADADIEIQSMPQSTPVVRDSLLHQVNRKSPP